MRPRPSKKTTSAVRAVGDGGRTFVRGDVPDDALPGLQSKISSQFGELAPSAGYTLFIRTATGVRMKYFDEVEVEELMHVRGWDAAKTVNYLSRREG